MSIRRAVILAAGRGQRLMPLTADQPKPMIPLAGQPMLERILRALRAAGIEEALIVHGYLGNVIEASFGDGAALGLRLTYQAQEALTGTARATLLAEEWCGDEPFLVHWGDNLVDPRNYPAIFARYRDADPAAACALSIEWTADPWAGGAVYRTETDVCRVIEKPPKGTSTTNWKISGVIVFSPLYWHYLRAVTPPDQAEFTLTEGIQLMLEQGHRVIPHEVMGTRIHVTTPDDVARLDDDPRLSDWDAWLATQGVGV
jgi:dTDP-glucose pyrophosphorylase